MDETIQCEFYTQTDNSLERCQKPFTNIYTFEDGSNIKVCDNHFVVVLENINTDEELSKN